MALGFNVVKGEAEKSKVPSYKMRDGENKIRIYGGVLARYIYWIPNSGGQKSPVECLEFNRATEKFDRAEKDWVKDYYPDLSAEWAYASLCEDLKEPEGDRKVYIFNHKKKLFGTIVNMVPDLGDPSDPDTGWDIVFNKAKTGPKVFNVEYTVMQLKCKPRPLSDVEKVMFSAHPNIDDVLKRAPAEDIKKYLDTLRSGAADGKSGESIDDDIPAEFSGKS